MATIQDDVVRLEKADGSRKLVTTDCVYDLTEDKTQEAVNSEIKNTLTQLDGAKAAKVDLTNISQTSPNCTVTNGIAKGTYFYLDGVLTQATEAISENAPFTSSNCETVTAGGLNELNNKITREIIYRSGNIIVEKAGNIVVCRSIADAASSSDIRNTIIPEGSRPQVNVGIPIMIFDNVYKMDGKHLLVNTTGGIEIIGSTGSPDTKSSFSYSVFNGSWIS